MSGGHFCEVSPSLCSSVPTSGRTELSSHSYSQRHGSRRKVFSFSLSSKQGRFILIMNVVYVYQRLSRYQQFKDFQRRILVATNLFGRGMDIERVNIVFNYDMPEDSDTYLHRVCSYTTLPSIIILHLCSLMPVSAPLEGGPCRKVWNQRAGCHICVRRN